MGGGRGVCLSVWVWLQEGNDIVVTENVLWINFLRGMTMIDLYKKTPIYQ